MMVAEPEVTEVVHREEEGITEGYLGAIGEVNIAEEAEGSGDKGGMGDFKGTLLVIVEVIDVGIKIAR